MKKETVATLTLLTIGAGFSATGISAMTVTPWSISNVMSEPTGIYALVITIAIAEFARYFVAKQCPEAVAYIATGFCVWFFGGFTALTMALFGLQDLTIAVAFAATFTGAWQLIAGGGRMFIMGTGELFNRSPN